MAVITLADLPLFATRCRNVLMEKGSHPPTIFAVKTNRVDTFIVADYAETPGRHAAIEFLGYMDAQEHPERLQLVVWASEAWVSTIEHPTKADLRLFREGKVRVEPRNDPARREVLIVSGLDPHTGKVDVIQFRIVRDGPKETDKLIGVEPDDIAGLEFNALVCRAFARGFMGREIPGGLVIPE